jgi:hypothetical protein
MSAKAKTKERGYGKPHQRLRALVARQVAAGVAYCSRCGGWIPPGTPFDLDHSDDRNGYLGASHRYCNRSSGARRANALRQLSRQW